LSGRNQNPSGVHARKRLFIAGLMTTTSYNAEKLGEVLYLPTKRSGKSHYANSIQKVNLKVRNKRRGGEKKEREKPEKNRTE